MFSEVVSRFFEIYYFLLLARIILSWIPLPSQPVLDRAVGVLYELTEPYLNIFRRLLPMASFGGMGFDFSPIIGFFVLQIIGNVVVAALRQYGV